MPDPDPIALLFGDLGQQGPGTDAHTARLLARIPREALPPDALIVDAGCGSGRQSLVLATQLSRPVHALDTYAPFLDRLGQRAAAAGLADRIHPLQLDMARIDEHFGPGRVDLVWSEGAAYSIGTARALDIFARALRPGGHLGLSELVWLSPDPPTEARAWFAQEYPQMRDAADMRRLVEEAGFELLADEILPPRAWTEGYYDPLELRAEALAQHEEATVRAWAEAMQQEIAMFRRHGAAGVYGYLFVLARREG